MSDAITAAWIASLLFFGASIAAVLLPRPRRLPSTALAPCSLIVPIKGASPHLARNLAALAALEPFRGEIILALADVRDPGNAIAAPIVAAHAGRIRLLTGEAVEFANPKLRNLAKAYRAARFDVIVFFDDTVSVDAGLLAELLGRLAAGARAATAAPLGCEARNLPAEVEAATCNGYLFRIEALLDVFGAAAGFGNAFAFRKADLEAAGGLERLAEGPCEDNALTRALRGLGGRFELAHRAAKRPIGVRTWRNVAFRHLRWKNCTKCHDPLAFLLEFWIGGLAFNLLGAAALSHLLTLSWWAGLGASAAIWYGGEFVLSCVAGWTITWRSPFAWVLRDLVHPALTIAAAFTRAVDWRGARIETRWRWPQRARR